MAKRDGDIWLMERLAKEEAFDSFRFMAMFPAGPRVLKFLDAYYGLVQIEGDDDKGFITIKQIDEAFPDLQCMAVTEPTEESA